MAALQTPARQKFFVEIIKPSHYDDDGYVIQWLRAIIPSNSLACLCALAHAAGQRRVLGDDVRVVVNVYDESNTVSLNSLNKISTSSAQTADRAAMS
jgi:hypothetical protein